MPYFIKLALLTTALVFPLAVFVWWRGKTIFGSLRWRHASLIKKIWSWFLVSFLVYPIYLVIWYYGDMDLSYNNQSRFLALYFWTGVVLITQLFWILVVLIIGLFIGKLAAKRYYQKYIRYIPVGASFLIFTITVYVAVNAYMDMNRIVLDEPVKMETAFLQNGEELRIVHISDLQADIFTNSAKMERYIDRVNSQYPDLVFFTGDLITEGPSLIPAAAALMGKIKSTYGTYAVFGDHDIWYGRSGIEAEYRKHGIIVLENENHLLKLPVGDILLTGVTQGYSERISDQVLSALLNDSTYADLRISMAHQPSESLVEAFRESGYDIFLGGHTHGGQIVIPFFFVQINPAQTETPYPVGAYLMDGFLVNVNAGLGASLSPLRYGSPAAVSTILLH